jgi:hypothetical protein
MTARHQVRAGIGRSWMIIQLIPLSRRLVVPGCIVMITDPTAVRLGVAAAEWYVVERITHRAQAIQREARLCVALFQACRGPLDEIEELQVSRECAASGIRITRQSLGHDRLDDVGRVVMIERHGQASENPAVSSLVSSDAVPIRFPAPVFDDGQLRA